MAFNKKMKQENKFKRLTVYPSKQIKNKNHNPNIAFQNYLQILSQCENFKLNEELYYNLIKDNLKIEPKILTINEIEDLYNRY